MGACDCGAAMSLSNTITDDAVFTALRTFLAAVLPTGTEVIQTQDNGVPLPLGGFVSMNNVGQRRLATNVSTHAPGLVNPGARNVETDTEYTIQVDCYGNDAGSWANTIQMLFRDPFAYDIFPSNIKPLFADGPIQVPLINGEQQWEQRWRTQAVMQTNAEVVVPQDYADKLNVGIIAIDV
jgi:hypothetical protein